MSEYFVIKGGLRVSLLCIIAGLYSIDTAEFKQERSKEAQTKIVAVERSFNSQLIRKGVGYTSVSVGAVGAGLSILCLAVALKGKGNSRD